MGHEFDEKRSSRKAVATPIAHSIIGGASGVIAAFGVWCAHSSRSSVSMPQSGIVSQPDESVVDASYSLRDSPIASGTWWVRATYLHRDSRSRDAPSARKSAAGFVSGHWRQSSPLVDGKSCVIASTVEGSRS